MKKEELKNIIKECINEILNESFFEYETTVNIGKDDEKDVVVQYTVEDDSVNIEKIIDIDTDEDIYDQIGDNQLNTISYNIRELEL